MAIRRRLKQRPKPKGSPDPKPEARTIDPEDAPRFTVEVDPLNEMVIIGAAVLLWDEEQGKSLIKRLVADHFKASALHREIWAAFREMRRRNLGWDPETLRTIADDDAVKLVLGILEARTEVPPNLWHHVERLEWDRARAEATEGPLDELVRSISNSREAPERTRALARQVVVALEEGVSLRHLANPDEIVREQSALIRDRAKGVQVYPYGLDGFDWDEDAEEWRIVPGIEPGLLTVVTGISGGGKSTLIANIALAQEAAGKRGLYGVWEMGKRTLPMLAGLRLGFRRQAVKMGTLSPEDLEALDAEMERLSKRIRFFSNPAGKEIKRYEKARDANEAQLDLIHSYIAETGADYAIFDLWERAFRFENEQQVSEALFRTQAIAEETRCHVILAAQQRLKDIEAREDSRPTREGIKGSSAWVDIGDAIFGAYCPGLVKDVPNDTFEVIVLKQRDGRWPMVVEFDWDPVYGTLKEGREVRYDRPGQGGETKASDSLKKSLGDFKGGKRRG